MSSFYRKLKNPKTGKLQQALCLDDYFGSHRYGYIFKKDGSDIGINADYPLKDSDVFKEEEINFIYMKDWKEAFYKQFKSPLGYSSIDNKNNSIYDLENFISSLLSQKEKEVLKESSEKIKILIDRCKNKATLFANCEKYDEKDIFYNLDENESRIIYCYIDFVRELKFLIKSLINKQ